MKLRTLNILTVIACGYILLSELSQLSVQFPRYLTLNELSLLQIKYIPMSLALTYIMLSIFVLIKKFVKQVLIVRIVGAILGICGVVQLLSINAYLSQTLSYVISMIKYFPLMEYMVIFENFVLLLYGLLAVLICVNNFKSFISSKSALIITLVVICLGLLSTILQNATMSIELFKNIRYLINFVIIVIMKYPALFLIYYIALKPTLAEKGLQPKAIETNE